MRHNGLDGIIGQMEDDATAEIPRTKGSQAMRDAAILANDTIDALHRLAQAIDAQYADETADAQCTNEVPTSDTETMVRILHAVALTLNGSGLCDSGAIEPIHGTLCTYGLQVGMA